MRFDNFPLELKRMIVSYFSPKELRDKISPVSKDWNFLARDRINGKNVAFCDVYDRIRSVGHMLQGKWPHKITLKFYFFEDFDLTDFPKLNSVKEIHFDCCTFPDSDAVGMLVQFFPNIRKLSTAKSPDDFDEPYEMDGLISGLKYLSQWKNLKSVELDQLEIDIFNEIVADLVKQDHQLEELVLLRSGIINNSTLKLIIKHHGSHLQTFTMHFNSITCVAYLQLTFCRNLKSLSLISPRKMQDREFVLIIQVLKQLSFLRVEFTRKLFSDDFRDLFFKDVKLCHLKELVLNQCSKFDNRDLEFIVGRSPLLKKLTLRNLNRVTNKGIHALHKVGSNLKTLHLDGIKHVTKGCLIRISHDLPNLCEIVATNCSLISDGKKCCIIYDRFLNRNVS